MSLGSNDDAEQHRSRLAQTALNEAAFRNLNGQVYGLGGTGANLLQFSIACECGSASCAVTLEVGATLYGEVRSDPHRFVVMSGHEDLEIERVEQRHGEVVVVEKQAGEPQRLVEATDPRSTDAPS